MGMRGGGGDRTPQAATTIQQHFLLARNGDDIAIDTEKCSGCGLCVKACPADAIGLKDDKAQTRGTIECMACADCVAICKEEAIVLTRNYRYSGYCKSIGYGDLTPPRL